jgi:hypothetical protein
MVRIPRGLLEDLSGVIFKHDVLFLENVCRELSIPFREAKMKILGQGEEPNLEITGELCDGDTQCQIWRLDKISMIYQQCPGRQMPGHSACELHNMYYEDRINDVHFVKKDELAGKPELEWYYNESSQEHILWHPLRKKFYSKNLTSLEGKKWTDSTSDISYILHISERDSNQYRKQHLASKN